MKRKILLSPLIIIIFIVLAGVGLAGAAIFIGNTTGDANSQGINLQKGLVGWWTMDGDAKDRTPYRNHGTVTGATLSNDRKSQALKAYIFDGINDVITVADTTALNPSVFSVSFWIKKNAEPDDFDKPIGKFKQPVTREGWQVSFTASSTLNPRGLYFSVWDTLGNEKSNSTLGTTLAVETWRFYAYTFDGSTLTYYENGVSLGTTSMGGTTFQPSSNPFAIGAYNDGTGGPTVAMDDVRFYNRALTPTEVAALYQEYNPGIQVSDLQKGLVGQWNMNGNANDSTLNSNHGTVTGATLTTDRKGQTNKAYSFNGTTAKINLGNSTTLQLSNNVTLAVWVNVTATAGLTHPNIIAKINSNQQGYGLFLDSDSSYKPRGAFYNGVSWSTSTVLNPTALTLGIWYHIVYTYDQAVHRLYINGTQTNSKDDVTGGIADTTKPLGIGYSSNGDVRFFNGLIDDARVYNRALSATEVTALYQEYNPGIQISDLQKGLVGNWNMNGNANDSTLNSNHGTVTGATLTTDRKGQTNKAYTIGSSKTITFGNSSSHNLSTTDFTITLWVKGSPNTGKDIFGKWDASGGYSISQAVNKFIFFYKDSGHYRYFFTEQSDAWTFLTVVRSGSGTINVYTNGVTDNGATSGGGLADIGNSATNLTLSGGGAYGAQLASNHSVEDVRIYNRALSATEITALYQSY